VALADLALLAGSSIVSVAGHIVSVAGHPAGEFNVGHVFSLCPLILVMGGVFQFQHPDRAAARWLALREGADVVSCSLNCFP
jgi:hypothetical protein